MAQDKKHVQAELGQGTLDQLAYIAGNPQAPGAGKMASDALVTVDAPQPPPTQGTWMREEFDPWSEQVNQTPSAGISDQVAARIGPFTQNLPSGAIKHFNEMATQGPKSQLFMGWQKLEESSMKPDDLSFMVLSAEGGDLTAQQNLKDLFGFVPTLDQHMALLSFNDLVDTAEEHGHAPTLQALKQLWLKQGKK